MHYEKRIVKIAICQINNPLFDEKSTFVEIEDEAGGEFIKISQVRDDSDKDVRIDPKEWEFIKQSVDELVKLCRDYN
jgi:hypothetical protein